MIIIRKSEQLLGNKIGLIIIILNSYEKLLTTKLLHNITVMDIYSITRIFFT